MSMCFYLICNSKGGNIDGSDHSYLLFVYFAHLGLLLEQLKPVSDKYQFLFLLFTMSSITPQICFLLLLLFIFFHTAFESSATNAVNIIEMFGVLCGFIFSRAHC